MKKKLLTGLCLALCPMLGFGAWGCGGSESSQSSSGSRPSGYGDNYKVENTVADQKYLFGIGNLIGEETGVDDQVTGELIKNLGAKSVRIWMHFSWVMSDPTTVNPGKAQYYHDIIKQHQEDGMQVIVMNHHNFYYDGELYTSKSGVTPRPSDGEEYDRFLADYETSWYTLAKEFSEVEYWEIHNEANSDGFLKTFNKEPLGKDKARVFSDMLYYGSKGIHRANGDANTVMGGLSRGGDGSTTLITNFLNDMYDYMFSSESPSPYADDYFQIAAWHPYLYTYSNKEFRKLNNEVYEVIKTREGKDKKVFFTEMGWSDVNSASNQIPNYLEWMFNLIQTELKYVESVHYFRMYDRLSSNWGHPMEKKFGLFEDPQNHEVPNASETDEKYHHEVLGAPKPVAYKFQELAGGTGDLELMSKFLATQQ